MNLADKRIIPPKEWMHDIYIKDNRNNSLKDIMIENYLPNP